MTDKPKYIRFNKFLSEQPDQQAKQEAARLRQLKAELARIKRQRIFILMTVAALTLSTVVLSIQLLNHGTSNKTSPRVQPGEGNSKAGS